MNGIRQRGERAWDHVLRAFREIIMRWIARNCISSHGLDSRRNHPVRNCSALGNRLIKNLSPNRGGTGDAGGHIGHLAVVIVANPHANNGVLRPSNRPVILPIVRGTGLHRNSLTVKV